MKTNTLKIAAASAVMLIATGCSTMGGSSSNEPAPPANPNFAGEMNKFNAQFPNDKATKYEEISLNYNNAQKLDEKGNCHDKSKHPVVIVLTLDATGTSDPGSPPLGARCSAFPARPFWVTCWRGPGA